MRRVLLMTLLTGVLDAAACDVSDVTARIGRARWVNACAGTPCPVLQGTGVVENRCGTPVSVRLRIDGLDSRGEVVSTRELWPFGTRVIAAGSHPFSLDHWLDHDPAIASFAITPVSVRGQ